MTPTTQPSPNASPRLHTSGSTPRVVLLERIHPAADAVLSAAGVEITRHDGALAGDELIGVVRDAGASAVGIRSKSRAEAVCFAELDDLLGVGCFCIGTNQVDLDAARVAGVPVFNSPFSSTRSVAEITLAEIIALHRRLSERSAQMHEGRWVKSATGSREVRGRTLGIVGYGRIGSQVSVLAEALGMQVVFHDVAHVLALGNARPVEHLDELLAMADVVTLHVPANATTEGLLDADRIGRMKPGAMLLNNARGSVVDLEALAGALRSGHLAGAAVDVFPEEPVASESPFECPLRGLPNVLLTPHVGGSTEEAQEAIARDVAGKLVRFLRAGSTGGAVNVPEVDLPGEPEARRILHFHRNVPGVLRKVHAVVADVGANVSAEVLRTTGELGYVVLDVDRGDIEPMTEGLRSIEETVRLRVL